MTTMKPISLWDLTADEREVESAPLPETKIDVAIVGGGFTGLSTALHCAERGIAAHVVESRKVGHGGSGRNVGLVNAAAWLPPRRIKSILGPSYGPKFVALFSQAPRIVFDLIERHQIRCNSTRTGTIHAAHSPRGLEDLKERHSEWKNLSEPVHLLDRQEVGKLTGTDVFFGGLLDERAGTINPMAYCRGLARAARSAGAGISTGVRALHMERDGGSWKIATNAGTIRAEAVILGTNAYTDDLWPGLRQVFSTIHYLQMATEPLGHEARHILPQRQGLWDTGQIMFNFRRDAGNRLVIGTMGRVIGSKDGGLTRRWAERRIRRVFPDLEEVRIEEAWHGRIAMTPDHLPRILRLSENLWSPIGYNGRGITTGTIMGMAMADILTGADPDQLPLPVTQMEAYSGSAFKASIMDLAFVANQIWGNVR